MVILLTAVIAVRSHAGQEVAYIEWKPVEGALGYVVEIVDVFDDIILEKSTEGVRVEVNLPYGKYRYRVGMRTKFNKISSWSEWHTLKIVPALEPMIISATPAELPAKKGNRVIIRGENFYRSSEVMVKNADSELAVKNVKLVDPGTLSVTVDASGAKQGSRYDLVVQNPGDLLDLEAVASNKFTIMERPSGGAVGYYPGIETGYYSPTLGLKDAYSGSFGVKLFCEFRSLGKSHPVLSFLNKAPGLYPGVLLSVSGFLAPKAGFGSSTMLQLGFYFGYEFSFPLKGELKWHVSPVLGYKQYFRWHTYSGNEYFGTKPMLLLGGTITFDLPKNFFIGLALEYNTIFDLQPGNIVGVFVRCGYRL